VKSILQKKFFFYLRKQINNISLLFYIIKIKICRIILFKMSILFWILIIYAENYLNIFIHYKIRKNLIYFKKQMHQSLCNHSWK